MFLALASSVPRPSPTHPPTPFGRYKDAFVVYIQEAVLPSLRNHHDEHLLKQLKQRWDNHKVGGTRDAPTASAVPAVPLCMLRHVGCCLLRTIRLPWGAACQSLPAQPQEHGTGCGQLSVAGALWETALDRAGRRLG